jgi:hypothetical protein
MEVAIFHGRKTRDAIKICCALLGMGVEIGTYEEFFDETQVKKSELNEQTYIRPDDIDGLLVYPQDAKIEGYYAKLSDRGGPPAEKFQRAFSKSYILGKNLDDQLTLAFEIYNSHYFEMSLRARFLQLITVVECLAERRRQKDAIINHIKSLVEFSEQHLAVSEEVNREDIDSLVQGINNLKRESISTACRSLIRKHLGEEEAIVFKKCYDIRSKLSHKGAISSEADLMDYYSKLMIISNRLLHSLLSNQSFGLNSQ